MQRIKLVGVAMLLITAFVACGGNKAIRNQERGYTPLILAVHENDKEMVNILIAKGSNINGRDSDGYTPLLWAIDCGYIEIAKILVDKGADINLTDNKGTTPLIKSCSCGFPDFADILIDRGANVLAKDHSGQKAADYVNASLISFKRVFNPWYRDRYTSLWNRLAEKEELQNQKNLGR